jgi:Transposase, Mutator family
MKRGASGRSAGRRQTRSHSRRSVQTTLQGATDIGANRQPVATFTYKHRAVDVKQVGAELGVRLCHTSQPSLRRGWERLNKEVKRRADVVGILPNEASIIRLIGAVLLEQNDEWLLQHRYMQIEGMAELAAPQIDSELAFVACSQKVANELADIKMLTSITTSPLTERLIYLMLVDGRYRKYPSRLHERLGEAADRQTANQSGSLARKSHRCLLAGLGPLGKK